jgi:probable rRNA maturation factor
MKITVLSEDSTVYENDLSELQVREFLSFARIELRKLDSRIMPGFTVIFVTKKAIQTLNNRFRKVNEPTDVLSFPAEEKGYLGDLILSKEVVATYAESFSCSFQEELKRDLLHGLMHLQGYNHVGNMQESPDEEMFVIQEKILITINVRQ